MAPFPLIKLGYLAVKQISKPIANYMKRKAKSTPFFRKYICMPPAQFYHWLEVNFQLRLMGLGGAKNVDKLSEKEAIELGGEIVGETLVFVFASLILLSEYTRGARKEAAKEEKYKDDMRRMQYRIQEVGHISEVQEAQIRELQQKIDQLMLEKDQKAKQTAGIVHSLFGAKTSPEKSQ